MLSALTRERHAHAGGETAAAAYYYSDATANAGTSGSATGGHVSPAELSGRHGEGTSVGSSDMHAALAAFVPHRGGLARPPSRTMLSYNSPSVTMASTTPSEAGLAGGVAGGGTAGMPADSYLLPAGLASLGPAPNQQQLADQPTVNLQDLLLAPPHMQAESLLSGQGTTRCSESNHGDLA